MLLIKLKTFNLINKMIKLKDILSEIKDKIIQCKKCGWRWKLSTGGKDPYVCHKCNPEKVNEDLRDWFGKGDKGGVGGGGWDRYNSSGDRIGKCGDAKEGDAYSACLSKEKAEKLGKEGRASFVKRKRAAQNKGGDAKKGGEKLKGQKPIKTKTGASESLIKEIELFLEKNVPTDASKWAYYKAQAKKKYDIYPSALANGWAAKQYKAAGGGWKKK